MAKRSPILGFNHNIRHRGVVFHVQTEDSGVDNPHLFTHLFHGGTILSTRKLDYDPGSDEDVVKGLMQSQHKAILKELKSGSFDAKIDRYLGDHPDLKPAPGADTRPTENSVPPPDALAAQTQPSLADAAPTPLAVPLAVIEENTDATIRIEIEPEPGELTPPPEFAPPPAPPPRPPAAANKTMGFGSAMLGHAVRAAEQAAAAPASPSEPARARRAVPPAVPTVPPSAPRPAPGSVEFKPPAGPDAKRPRNVPVAVEPASDLSAALRAMSESDVDDNTSPSAAPPNRLREVIAAGATANVGADHVYIHTRSGRHSIDPANAEDPSQRVESIPPPAPPAPPAAPPAKAAASSKATAVMGSRSAVIGAPPKMVGGAPPATIPPGKATPRRARDGNRPGLFGKDLISEKSLDEVILAYLSEDGEEKK